MFRGIDDVLWWILVIWYVLSRNQVGATLAPLGIIFMGPKKKGYQTTTKCPITSLLLVLESWCLNYVFRVKEVIYAIKFILLQFP